MQDALHQRSRENWVKMYRYFGPHKFHRCRGREPPALSAPNVVEWTRLCLNSHPSAAFRFDFPIEIFLRSHNINNPKSCPTFRRLLYISIQVCWFVFALALSCLTISLDWATFQLMVEGAIVEPLVGHQYPPGIKFTPNGLVFGQPNEQLQPQRISIP